MNLSNYLLDRRENLNAALTGFPSPSPKGEGEGEGEGIILLVILFPGLTSWAIFMPRRWRSKATLRTGKEFRI